MLAKVMVPVIVFLAAMAVCQPVPSEPTQPTVPGVFIPADTLKSLEERARQNSPPLQTNAASSDQSNPSQSVNVNLNQPNQGPQNSIAQQNDQKPQPIQQQWNQQALTNPQQYVQQPSQQNFVQQPPQQQYIQQPGVNLQPQPANQQQWVQQAIPNQQLQGQWIQQPLTNQPQLIQAAGNQLRVLPNQQLLVTQLQNQPLPNDQQIYLSPQNGIPNQQAVLVSQSQPNQPLLVNQPNNQPLLVASGQPNQNLLIQNGQPGIVGSNALIGQVVSAPVNNLGQKPVQNNLYELVPLNNQNVANNLPNGNTYLVPIQQLPSTSMIVNQG